MKTKQTKSKQKHIKTTKHMNRWRRDFATELPAIPQGAFVPASDCTSDDGSHRSKTSLVLRGDFDASRFDISTPDLPGKIEVGWDLVGRAVTLVFRVQRGADMLCWYANPADPHIWEALDIWGAEGRLTLSFRLPDGGPEALFGTSYELHQKLQEIRFPSAFPKEARATLTAAYLENVCPAIVSGEIKRKTRSIVPEYPRLRNVQACIVQTEETGGVVVNMVDEKPGESFLDAVLRRGVELAVPAGTRH
ncbi:hypothetical protein VAR608DRAFT_1323 [Variovorax sp. HW608]|uniref:hypothetical protein n=1 Tax=Variovorax sp. HW608 TaxID=1034889 RepID=UPI0008201D8E|nr:hypothetical protein [Variovorax sp. HW608]SCK18453.1 hypothetical protein VAR608DRAFT_1323 [Variovorax sp. HW608]